MRKQWSGAGGGCSFWNQGNKCIFMPNAAPVLQIPKQTPEDGMSGFSSLKVCDRKLFRKLRRVERDKQLKVLAHAWIKLSSM